MEMYRDYIKEREGLDLIYNDKGFEYFTEKRYIIFS